MRAARDAGLDIVALTDHDTTDGWDEAREACADLGLTFVPGIEFSASNNGSIVHLLGYLVDPDKVRDKDGISAAVDFLAMAGELRAQGKTVAEHLSDFADTFGAFASTQISIRVNNLADIPAISGRFRTAPPSHLAGKVVTAIDDFANGFENFPPSDLIRLTIEGGSRVIVRPSGTEPKLKIYIDAAVTDGDNRIERVTEVVAALEADLRSFIA